MNGLKEIVEDNKKADTVHTFREQMLNKYPNMYKVGACSVCKSDLRYSFRIHRVGMEWYCNKCFTKYRGR